MKKIFLILMIVFSIPCFATDRIIGYERFKEIYIFLGTHFFL